MVSTKIDLAICKMKLFFYQLASAKNYLLCKVSIILSSLFLSVQPVFCGTIWDAGDAVAGNLLDKVVALYTGKLFFLLLVVHGVLYFAILKDEKKKDICKKTFIGCCIAYVLCKCYGIVGTTLDDITETFNSSPGSGIGE